MTLKNVPKCHFIAIWTFQNLPEIQKNASIFEFAAQNRTKRLILNEQKHSAKKHNCGFAYLCISREMLFHTLQIQPALRPLSLTLIL